MYTILDRSQIQSVPQPVPQATATSKTTHHPVIASFRKAVTYQQSAPYIYFH
jgi:hypothetical protein